MCSTWLRLFVLTVMIPFVLVSCSDSEAPLSPEPVPPTITTSSLPGGMVGHTYNTSLAATGGEAPHAWSMASGTLVAGLRLSPEGG